MPGIIKVYDRSTAIKAIKVAPTATHHPVRNRRYLLMTASLNREFCSLASLQNLVTFSQDHAGLLRIT